MFTKKDVVGERAGLILSKNIVVKIRIIKIIIVVAWFVLVGYIALPPIFKEHNAAQNPKSTLRTPNSKLQTPHSELRTPNSEPQTPTEWLGIYYQDKKIGYVSTRWSKTDNSLYVNQKYYLRMQVHGETGEVTTLTSARLDEDFRLREFKFTLRAREYQFNAVGLFEDGELRVDIISGDSSQELKFSYDRPPRFPIGINRWLANSGITKGEYSFTLFEPSSMSEMEVRVRVLGEEKLKLGDEEINALHVEQSMGGISISVWIDHLGRTLKEESPLGFVLYREDEDVVLYEGWSGGVDVIASTSIPTNMKIDRPREVLSMTLKLTGDVSSFDLNDHRQRISGNILTIQRERLPEGGPSITLPIKDARLAEYLNPEPFVQSDDPVVRSLIKDIIPADEDAGGAVNAINAWLKRNIEKGISLSIPNALDVIRVRRGDCNEFAVLFAALSRAAGIPTRVVSGLVYSEDRFYYHAWNEVCLEQWISVDSIMDQFPVDATHIKLVEGGLSSQVKILNIIGKLGIEIVEYN